MWSARVKRYSDHARFDCKHRTSADSRLASEEVAREGDQDRESAVG